VEVKAIRGLSEIRSLGVQLKLTDRGWKVSTFALLLVFLGFFFRDLVLIGLGSSLAMLVVYVVLRMRRAMGDLTRLVVLRPNKFEGSLTAGEKFEGAVLVESSVGARLRFTCPLEHCFFQPSEVEAGDSRLMFMFQPTLADEYSSENLSVVVRDRFGLVRAGGGLSFQVDFRVYPRVLAVALEAARFLLEAGGLGFAEQQTKLKGAGLEYAGSRGYVAGDTLRHMDWKATARLGRLVVKEFYVEGGTGVHLAYEAVASDPVSADKLSAAFLNTALALAKQDLPLGLTVHDGREILLHVPRLQPALAVTLALQYALKSVETDVEQLYMVLEPKAASELRGILRQLEQIPLRQLLQAELTALADSGTEPYQVLRQVLVARKRVQLILVASLTGDPLPVLELAGTARNRNRRLQLLQPTKPWVSARSLEEAYRLYDRYAKLNRSLESRGILVAGSAEKLSHHLAAAQILARATR
jgi:uncharacterized protein (DUF58 family)